MTTRLPEIRAFNEATQLGPQQARENERVAKQSYYHAVEVQTRANEIYQQLYELDSEPGAFQDLRARDIQSREINRAVLQRQVDGLNKEWGPDREWDDRWMNKAETEQRRIQAREQGIRVLCTVEWGTDTPTNPLLLIHTALSRNSPAYFPSHATKNAASGWHVSICRMNDVKTALPNDWWALTVLVFEKFHNREVWLFSTPWWTNKDTGLTLDPQVDPIASDPTIQTLNATYFPEQGRGIHITL